MIEVGELIRTKQGYIYKVKSVHEDMIWVYDTLWISEQEIVKHSKNLIDLIEKGDYVNGDEVVAVDYTEDEQGNYIDVLGTMEIDDDYAYPIILKNEDIRTIVTHEQFEQIKYKVKEN